MGNVPTTLQDAITYFSAGENCRAYMVTLRWPDGKVLCPRCGSSNVDWLPNAGLYKCYEKHDRQKFSLKVGTLFEDSPIPLAKWLPVIWMLVNCKNGVSSYEIHGAIGVTQKTAWFMLQRARLATQDPDTGCLRRSEMKASTSEMIEGPVAWTRFTSVMKQVMSVPHSEIKKRIDEHRAAAANNPNRPGPKPKRKVKTSASRAAHV